MSTRRLERYFLTLKRLYFTFIMLHSTVIYYDRRARRGNIDTRKGGM